MANNKQQTGNIMKTNMKRREAISKAAVVAGTLLALKSEAAPGPSAWPGVPRGPGRLSFAGGWLYQGQPCAIFQEGSVVLAVNEAGNLGTAQVTAHNTLTVVGGGWDLGLVGTMDNSGRTITWSNDTVWTRSQF
jgi:hypothetical protein